MDPHPWVMCRWTGYNKDIVQRVPCYPVGGGPPPGPDPAPGMEGVPALPRVPRGYLQDDIGAAGVRTSWTVDDTITPASTWLTDSALKFSADEIVARGNTGEQIRQQVCRVVYHYHNATPGFMAGTAIPCRVDSAGSCCRCTNPLLRNTSARPKLAARTWLTLSTRPWASEATPCFLICHTSSALQAL